MNQNERANWNGVNWDWVSWLAKVAQSWHCQPLDPVRSERSHPLQRYFLLVSLIVLTVGYSPTAYADALVGSNPDAANEPPPANLDANWAAPDRLIIPSEAVAVPVGSSNQSSELPPPPALTELPLAEPVAQNPPAPEPVAAAVLRSTKPETTNKSVELAFNLPPVAAPAQPAADPAPLSAFTPAADPALVIPEDTGAALALDRLFQGKSESLVAKAVGSAEGTRTPEGDRNPAYYGHVDPGNKAWNLGSFSYQHSAASPEEADAKQLDRLQDQAAVIQTKAAARGMTLTIEETLNGIDLANQAPIAALDQGGYIDWLAQAHESGLSGDEAVLWARTQSFLDPHTQQWNAPGLGNTEASISRDQERRMLAIDRAIAAYQQKAQAEQPVSLAQASLHNISEEVGIARLFAEQVVSRFGDSAALPAAAEPWTAPGLTPAASATGEAAEPMGIRELFSLDLPAS